MNFYYIFIIQGDTMTLAEWKDRRIERENTYKVLNNKDCTVTLIPVTGEIYESGTPLNALNLNKINASLEQKALQSDLVIERERINNLTKLGEGSTTGDAELIDGRVGAYGVSYSNIGDSIRTQFGNSNSNIKQMRDFIEQSSIEITVTEYVGYLNAKGELINDNNLHCKITNKIYCNEGWIFSYFGQANANAVSYIMYNGNKIIENGQHDRVDINITIPKGVDNIVFSSYNGVSSEIKLNVLLLEPKILTKDNLINNLYSKISVSEFNNEVKKIVPYDYEEINKNNMVKVENKYLSISGRILEANTFNYYEIDVKEGEIYSFDSSVIWMVAPYHICDKNGNTLIIGGDLTQHDEVTFFNNDEIIIPNNAYKLRVCSGDKLGDTDFVLCRKKVKAPLLKKEIPNLIVIMFMMDLENLKILQITIQLLVVTI